MRNRAYEDELIYARGVDRVDPEMIGEGLYIGTLTSFEDKYLSVKLAQWEHKKDGKNGKVANGQ